MLLGARVSAHWILAFLAAKSEPRTLARPVFHHTAVHRKALASQRGNKPWFLESPLSWALAPECRILIFKWSSENVGSGGGPNSFVNLDGLTGCRSEWNGSSPYTIPYLERQVAQSSRPPYTKVARCRDKLAPNHRLLAIHLQAFTNSELGRKPQV